MEADVGGVRACVCMGMHARVRACVRVCWGNGHVEERELMGITRQL